MTPLVQQLKHCTGLNSSEGVWLQRGGGGHQLPIASWKSLLDPRRSLLDPTLRDSPRVFPPTPAEGRERGNFPHTSRRHLLFPSGEKKGHSLPNGKQGGEGASLLPALPGKESQAPGAPTGAVSRVNMSSPGLGPLAALAPNRVRFITTQGGFREAGAVRLRSQPDSFSGR